MYTLNIASTIKKMLVNGLRDFILENYYYSKKHKGKESTR